MVELAIDGILKVFTLGVLLPVIGGVLIGLTFGLMPGIGVSGIMAIIIPFSFGMDPTTALSLLLAIHAVGCTGGSITAIVLNIPGTGINAATLIDGFPLAQQGKAARACGAALGASGLGGVLGGLVLAGLIPVAYPIIMAFGAAETFLVTFLGLSFIAVLSAGSTVKGLVSGFVGILLSFVGFQGMTAIPRFTFGTLALYDGFNIIPIVVGLFAIPEVINLATGRRTIAEVSKTSIEALASWKETFEGIKDVFRHWKLFLRSAAIGTGIGTIPGVGGEAAVFVAYGQAKQTSKHPEKFGTGCIEGVIAPEAANNAKEGGSMLPTLAFGVPGSVLMAVLLAAFMVHGIQPGPAMIREHLDLTASLVVVLILSNILGVLVLLPVLKYVTRICFVPGVILVPLILVLAAFGSYAATRSFEMGVLATLVFGGIGYMMVRGGYNRVALVLGVMLGNTVETYGYIAFRAHGLSFLTRPIPIILVVVIALVLSSDWLRKLFSRGKRP